MKTTFEAALDALDYEEHAPPKTVGDLPYVVRSAVLSIPGVIDLRVYVLSDGRRIVNAEDLERFFCGDE